MAEDPEVDIRTLNPQQLVIVQQSLEQELDTLATSGQALQTAKYKFIHAKNSLSSLKLQNSGKEMLIPLTSMLYVPGFIREIGKVTVELGTGYFVQMDID